MKNLLLILLVSIALASCKYKNEWHVVSVNNHFSVELPDYMTESNKLREDATLQYENRYRNTYIIVIEHDKKEMILANFDTQVIRPLLTYVDKGIITDSTNIKIGELNARMNKIMGEMPSGDEKENIYYTHYSVDGKKKFYEICTWTRGPKRLDQYGPDLKRMMDSFKEL